MESYEFTAEQNQVIGSLASRMRWVSILFVLIGIGLLISLVPNIQAGAQWVIVVASALFAVINLLKGVVFYRPVDNLSNIVEREGTDIAELLQAFRELSQGFSWMVILNIILIVMLSAGTLVTLFGY